MAMGVDRLLYKAVLGVDGMQWCILCMCYERSGSGDNGRMGWKIVVRSRVAVVVWKTVVCQLG